MNDNVLTKEIEKGGTDGLLRYVYDNADRMITSKDEGNTDHEVYIWDDADNLSLLYDRNGSTVMFTYDKLNQLTRKDYTKANGIEGPSLVKFWYDAVGRIVTAYNQDSRIERKWNTLSKLEQDKVWVMPSAESGTGSTPRDVDYTYDANGLVATVEYPDNSFLVRRSYDALNRVTKIEKKVSGAWSDLATWAFQGPARMKTLDFANGTKETMAYDLYGRATTMLHDRLVGSVRTKMYEFGRGFDAASNDPFWKRVYGPYLVDQILWGTCDAGMDGTIDEPLYFHLDYLGSVVMLTRDTSNPPILETYRYDEYGQPYIYGGDGGSTRALSEYEQEKSYTSRRMDSETGIYYYRARYYDQIVGSFTSRDQMQDEPMNLYTYVNDRPTDRKDPFGLQVTEAAGLGASFGPIGAAVGAAVGVAIWAYVVTHKDEINIAVDDLVNKLRSPKKETEPRPDPKGKIEDPVIPIPPEPKKPEPPKESCKSPGFSQYPTCAALIENKGYNAPHSLEGEAVDDTFNTEVRPIWPDARKPGNRRIATGGPCIGLGTHYTIKDAHGGHIISMGCCPCCEDGTPPLILWVCRLLP